MEYTSINVRVKLLTMSSMCLYFYQTCHICCYPCIYTPRTCNRHSGRLVLAIICAYGLNPKRARRHELSFIPEHLQTISPPSFSVKSTCGSLQRFSCPTASVTFLKLLKSNIFDHSHKISLHVRHQKWSKSFLSLTVFMRRIFAFSTFTLSDSDTLLHLYYFYSIHNRTRAAQASCPAS